jgi:hypothetical protein
MAAEPEEPDTVGISLTPEEALVFFDWLARLNESDALRFDHPAEQRVLWDLEAILEEKLVTPFKPDYAELVEKARRTVVGK